MNTFPRTRLFAEALEARCVPAAYTRLVLEPSVVVGGAGGTAWVTRGDTTQELRPFGAFAGAVNVATADVNGDGVNDVVAGAGAGGASRVVVLDGKSGAELRSFLAFEPSFAGGVAVSTGDLNFDGYADVIAAVEGGGGAPHVKVFDGKTGAEVRSFFAFDPAYTGGVRAAATDITGDFRDDIVTAPAGAGGPNVRVFDGTSGVLLRSFFAYADGYTGGVSVAAADVDSDGIGDIVTGSLSGVGHVKVFSGRSGAEEASFFAFGPDQTGGVRVAAGLFNADLSADIAVSSGGSSRVLDGQTRAELADISLGGGSVGVGAAGVVSGIDPPLPVPNDPATA